MAKRTLVLLALALLLAGCSDDGNTITTAAIRATRDRQFAALATADARTAPQPAATITTEPLPLVVATMTPTPQPAPATATPGHTLNVFLVPVEAEEVLDK